MGSNNTQKKIIISLVFLFLFVPAQISAAEGTLQFKSGFNGTTQITGNFSSSPSDNWIEGVDGSLGDWSTLKIGKNAALNWVKQAYGYFEGGRMDIVNDPTGSNNRVLRLQNSNGGTRSQWELNQVVYWKDDGTVNKFDKQFYRYRMYIPSNITTVFGYNSWSEWYMIWENHTWEQYSNGNMTRNGIYLQKNPNSNLWYFRAYQARPGGCEGYDGPKSPGSCEAYWDNKNHQNIPVPFDQWFTFDVFYKYSETDGEWYVAITKDGQPRQEIAHYIGPTQFDGEKLHDQMIFKLYHDSRYSSSLGQTNQYYDDLEIWSDYPPGYLTSNASPTPSTSVGKPGDANNDGSVNGRDYVVWKSNYTRSVSGLTNGDYTNNGVVDGLDYVVWFNNYGK